MDSLFFKEYYVKISIFFSTGSTGPQNFNSVGVHRSRFKYGALCLLFSHISFIRTQNCVPFIFYFLWTPCSSRNILSKFQFFSQSDRPVCWASLYKELILVILEPKSYMARAHKLQIDLGQYFRSILGLVLGSLQPTMNPYGFLVVKQRSKCGESSSPRDCEKCLWSWFPRLMGTLSRAERGKNKGGSGKSRGSGIKSKNGKRERPFPWHFFFWGEKLCSSLVREKNRVWRMF